MGLKLFNLQPFKTLLFATQKILRKTTLYGQEGHNTLTKKFTFGSCENVVFTIKCN